MPEEEKSNAVRILGDLRSTAAGAPSGTRLPSIREICATYRASPVTVQQVIAKLAQEGLVVARPGHGTFVAPTASRRRSGDYSWQSAPLGSPLSVGGGLDELMTLPRPGALSLSSGFMEEGLQPRALLASAISRAARRPQAWGRVPMEGIEELRAYFAGEVGVGVRAHNVIVTPGGQAALSTVFRALAGRGDALVIESPTYIGAIAAGRAAGLRLVPVPSDGEGLRPDLLAEALRETGARLCYCQPRYANPTGTLMSAARRHAIMEAVVRAGAFLVEDDWVRDLDLEGPSPPPLAADDPDGHVIHVRSLTKPVAPGLRVGALIARGPVLARLRTLRTVDDFFVAPCLQEAALQVLSSPGWPKHLRGVRAELRERRDALVASLTRLCPDVAIPVLPRGGLHLWVRLPDGLDDARLAEEAAHAGVTINAGRDWFPAEPSGPYLRLSYAGADTPTLTTAVEMLSEVLVAISP